MAFARAIGEYGSVIFIAGNMPMVSEITPLIIIGKLEQYDYAGATAVAVVLLGISFVMLLVIKEQRHECQPCCKACTSRYHRAAVGQVAAD
jgi:ABC-type sulfate transport system permease component